ncbi:MAG: hypothetical protein HY267_05105, partial [Deltaproteobacteria bacterium]|nr:hypothetical protein [Deltaproteobacteria bacterium]
MDTCSPVRSCTGNGTLRLFSARCRGGYMPARAQAAGPEAGAQLKHPHEYCGKAQEHMHRDHATRSRLLDDQPEQQSQQRVTGRSLQRRRALPPAALRRPQLAAPRDTPGGAMGHSHAKQIHRRIGECAKHRA